MHPVKPLEAFGGRTDLTSAAASTILCQRFIQWTINNRDGLWSDVHPSLGDKMPNLRKTPTKAVRWGRSTPLLCTLAATALVTAAPLARAAEPIKICSIDDRSGAAADTGM